METIKIKPPVDPINPNFYLDKNQMREALREYRVACAAAELAGLPLPQIPNYLGECFLRIARGLSHKHNFRNYSYVNDMVMDGVMTCVRYIKNYDPDRLDSQNQPTSPLSYFTQCCHYAFIGRIGIEKKQSRVRRAILMQADIESYSVGDSDEDTEFMLNLSEMVKNLGPETEDDLPSMKEKKVKTGPLDGFFGVDHE